MKKSKKLIALAIAILMCLALLAACGGSDNGGGGGGGSDSEGGGGGGSTTPSLPTPDTAAPPVGQAVPAPTGDNVRFADELVIIMDDMPVANMNKFTPGSTVPANMWSFGLIYDRLVYPTNEVGTYDSYIATSWHTDDYQTFTFNLRDDVYFHNGDKFTTKDVLYTINLAKESPGSPASNVWIHVDEAIAIDDYTLQLNLRTVNVDYLYSLARPDAGFVNERAISENPESGLWVGTGPYSLVEWVANNYSVFERNDNYWGEPPITRKLTMRYVPERAARAIMMMNGEADLCMKIAPEDMDMFEDNPDWTVFDIVLNNPTPLVFNMTDPLTSDWNFRMAVASALNRTELAIARDGNYGLPAYGDGAYWGNYTEFRNTDIPMIPEDLDAARRYLDASPYNGETVEIIAAIAGNVRAMQALQMQLARVGIETEITTMESAAVPSYIAWENNQSQLYIAGMPLTFSAYSTRNIYYPGMTANIATYTNPEIAELYDRVATELDVNARKEMYLEIQRLAAEDIPYINIYWIIETVVGVNGLDGINWGTDAFWDFRYIYMQVDD